MMTIATKEHPILFRGRLVRAILQGRKTQTRRVMRMQPPEGAKVWDTCDGYFKITRTSPHRRIKCPYGQPGDQLWVRETWRKKCCTKHAGENSILTNPCECGTAYAADSPDPSLSISKWRPSIHMWKSESRISLEVTKIRVERIQEITAHDACAEGVFHDGNYKTEPPLPYPVATFKGLWDSINKKRGYGWEANPWVWVVEFTMTH